MYIYEINDAHPFLFIDKYQKCNTLRKSIYNR